MTECEVQLVNARGKKAMCHRQMLVKKRGEGQLNVQENGVYIMLRICIVKVVRCVYIQGD